MAMVALAPEARSAKSESAAFIETLGNDLIDVLRSPEADQEARKLRLRELFGSAFDVAAIGKFVLGRYWRAANDAQRQEYLGLFREHVIEIYAQRFASYSGETFEVVRERDLGPEDVLVEIRINRLDGSPLPVEFRVLSSNGSLRIVDTLVEGVSLIVTKRDEFGAVVAREGIDGLIERLRRITGSA